MLEPMPRPARRRYIVQDVIVVGALLLLVACLLFIARLAHAAPDAGVLRDASMSMPVPVIAPVQIITAPLLTPPTWLTTHWHQILGALLAWSAVASFLARRWPRPTSPPSSQYAVLAHTLLVDLPSALPLRDMAGVFGLPFTMPYASLSQHKKTSPSPASLGPVALLFFLTTAMTLSGCCAQLQAACAEKTTAYQNAAKVRREATTRMRAADCDTACKEKMLLAIEATDGSGSAP
jgi:quinol-cytochrome oxidoreductase complex cytochrome b subunit